MAQQILPTQRAKRDSDRTQNARRILGTGKKSFQLTWKNNHTTIPPAATAAIVQEEAIAIGAGLAETVGAAAPTVTVAIETEIARAVAKRLNRRPGRSSFSS